MAFHLAAAGGASANNAGKSAQGSGALQTAVPGGTPIDASRFAPGACERFPPTSGNRHLTVFLDAGHGGIDPGGIGTTESGQTVEEAQLTLPVELDTMDLLRADGLTVVVSRTEQTTVTRLGPGDLANGDLTIEGAHDDVVARDECANLAHADLLVGIYFDAGSSPDYAGALTAYDTARSFAADNERLATLVENDVLHALNSHGWDIPDDGAVPDNTLGSTVPTSGPLTGLAALAQSYDHLLLLGPYEAGYQTSPSRMPGVVTEPLYVTDPFEATVADSQAGQHAIAAGIAEAVEQYFGLGPSPTGGHDGQAR